MDDLRHRWNLEMTFFFENLCGVCEKIFKDIFGVNFDSPFRKVDFTFNLLELIDDSSSLDESKTPFGLIKDFFVNEKTQNSVFGNNQGFLNDQESWSNEKWFIRERIISLVKL